jgi:hypothetical protein
MVLIGTTGAADSNAAAFRGHWSRAGCYQLSVVHAERTSYQMSGPHDRVLVLGGSDGLGLREILRYPDVERVTVVGWIRR